MDIYHLLLWGLGVGVAFYILRYILAAQSVLGFMLQQTQSRVIPQSECPDFIQDLLREHGVLLTELGFHFSHCTQTRNVLYQKNENRFYYIYFHPSKHTYAYLTPSPEAEIYLPVNIAFTTYFQDGQRLSTLNGLKYYLFTEIPGTITQDAYTNSLEEQWKLHLDYIDKHPELEIKTFEESPLGWEELSITEQKANEPYITSLLEKKWIYEIEEGRYLVKTFPALIIASRLLKGNSTRNVLKNKLKTKGKKYDIPVKLEVENYVNALSTMNPEKSNNYGKFVYFSLTAALFILAFGFLFTFEIALIFCVILLIHETGHLVAMTLTGYKNIRLLFIPLFGAAAMGSDKGVKPYKRVITYFAGPVPGIILGFFALWLIKTGNMPFLLFQDAIILVIFTLFINYFNLLPVLPFDGGQILNTIIFSRYSSLQFIFILISAAGLGALLIILKEPVFFYAFLFVIPAFRHIFSRNKVILNLRNRFPDIGEIDETEIQSRVFDTLKHPPYDIMDFKGKFQLARYVEENINTPKPALSTVIITLIVYAALFIGPVYYLKSTDSIFYRFFHHTNPCELVNNTRLPFSETASPSRFVRTDAKYAKDFKLITYRSCFRAVEAKEYTDSYQGYHIAPQSDFLSRMWTLYGEPDMIKNGFSYTLKDLKTNLLFTVYMDYRFIGSYGGNEAYTERLIPALYLFEKLLVNTRRSDCSLDIDFDYSEITKEEGFALDKKSKEYLEKAQTKWTMGCKNGHLFFEIRQKNTGAEKVKGEI